MIKDKRLLLIFTRNPELGKCKTRLASTVGDQAALDIYKFLLEHTADVTKQLPFTKWVCYSESIKPNDHWEAAAYEKKLQEGEDLGERMENAFKAGFAAGFEQIIIIGSDLYDLNSRDILQAFEALDSSEVVIGPAQDGGYYLLGMKKLHPPVFRDKNWGINSVLQDTYRDLDEVNVTKLQLRNDVDVYEDIVDIPAFQPFLKHIKR
ncbi:TIGR04282 family arsenosugar biosynthesis glycosyltransferase [Zeaxanthinibacter enoshimensis]|uniref:Glycosyltransferase n=1 Tax=Zeaxanthinibacter enoshimensis TaxID=392009 RepID=A0A4R6TNX8_9FLAO|nr:TIGR04282 family arsenosugar biosynthesis glycosyltransferase [Zeaxanthinibacter enoshimensis]TDQ33302.1 hypothetical protein CLV82_1140 [Zeaxanthinibacter enoshimensis]